MEKSKGKAVTSLALDILSIIASPIILVMFGCFINLSLCGIIMVTMT